MTEASGSTRTTHFLYIAAAFVVIVAGLQAAQSIVVPFLLSAFIAIICAPPLFWLKRHRVPTPIALVIVIGALVIVGGGVLTLVGTSLNEFSTNLPVYQEMLRTRTEQVATWLESQGMERTDNLLLTYLDPQVAMRFVTNLLTGLGGALTNAFLILITVIFILLEAAIFEGKLKAVFRDSETSLGRIHRTLADVRQYMFLKTLLSILTGVLIWMWLRIVGVDYAALWGLLALLLNFIPTIGSVIAAVPAVILAVIQLGLGAAIWTGAGYLVVNMVIGNFVDPRVVGRGLDLSPLVVFGSLVFWGWVLGPVGMLLSVPLTMTLRIILEGQPETRPIAVLLAGSPPPPVAPAK